MMTAGHTRKLSSGVMKTSSKHLHRAFTHWACAITRGIQFGKGTIRIEDQGDLLEIQDESPAGRCLLQSIRRGKNEDIVVHL